MNIERKNTLFVLGLVLVVLGAAAMLAYFLIAEHVEREISRDLARAHRVFTEAQKNTFRRMVGTARGLTSEPALLAAALTDDVPTVGSMLEDLFARTDVELIAVYLDSGQTGVGRKAHFSSPQVLSSEPFLYLVRKLALNADTAYSNALIYETFLRLAAVPIRSPMGGRLGALMLGDELDQAEVEHLRQLVRAHVLVLSGNVVLGSTLPELDVPVHELVAAAGKGGLISFTAGGERYVGRLYPILSGYHERPVAHLLLAHSSDAEWAPYRSLARSAGFASALILLFAALAGIAMSRASLTRPIRALAAAARAISAGDLSVKVDEDRKDELGELARSFNRMLASLNASRVEIKHSRRRFHDFAEASSDWLWESDRAGRFTYVSSTVTASLGFSPSDLLGRTLAEVFPGDDVSGVMSLLRPPQGAPPAFKDVEIWVTSLGGHRRCLRLNGIPTREGDLYTGFRGTARDITKAKRDEERLVVLAYKDVLTGLANRRRFLSELGHEVQRAGRSGTSGALMFLDLDHIKLINDTAGHAAGDQVIVQVAGFLRGLAHNEDLVARLSGDEFALAFPHMDAGRALDKAREILERISQLKPIYAGKIITTSASIGVVVFPGHGTDPVDLLAKADTAMYAAKHAGRNRVHLYSEADRARELMDSQLTWRDRIRQALEEDLLELMFQPIAPAAGGPARRVEVLVRMRTHEGKVYSPGNFIPTAEQFGLIQQVDRVVVGKAMRRLAALQAQGHDLDFSVNLSGLSVGDPAMFEYIQNEIAATGVDQRHLTFEVTESAACENFSAAMDFIGRVRQLGCRFSLDDFGVGFSSFSYLKNLRVDMLKIDGSFIREIHHNREDRLFVKALVDVARGMNIKTTAEFVENAEVLAQVAGLGVDYVQGYYVGRPRRTLPLEGGHKAPPPRQRATGKDGA